MPKEDISLLVVDDEDSVRRVLVNALSSKFVCHGASNAEDAIQILSISPANLVLTDIMMPSVSGIELCERVNRLWPETVVVMLSEQTAIQYAIEAMRQGAFDYVTKPFDLPSVLMSVDRALRYQALLVVKRRYEQVLEETVCKRTQELRLMNDNLNTTLEALYTNYHATLRALAKALEARNVEPRGHSDRVVAYCLRLGKEMGLAHSELIALEQGALLHDIGKIGVRDSILMKPGPLTADEWVEMREHVNHGLQIIEGIDFLSGAGPVVSQHHEKYDGTGYPTGLRAETIHMHARIFAVADAFDAITSDRPYRAGRPYAPARAEIITSSGLHLDPRVVKAFLRVSEEEWRGIRSSAELQQYSQQIIDRHEVRSFVVSLKGHCGTGPLSLPQPQSVGLTLYESLD